jgi:hypothetical protein
MRQSHSITQTSARREFLQASVDYTWHDRTSKSRHHKFPPRAAVRRICQALLFVVESAIHSLPLQSFNSLISFWHPVFLSDLLSIPFSLLFHLFCTSLIGAHFLPSFPPNIVVEWLTLLLRIREFPSSIFGPGERLSWMRFFVVFLSASRRIQR